MPPGWAVEARVGSQLPSNGVGRTWKIDPGPTAVGAPRVARAAIANPGWNALPGNVMGGGCQAKARAVQYAHAVPPSWNAGDMDVLVQRAYFSACRMVFVVPSVMSANRVTPWGPGGSLAPDTRPLG